MTLTDPARPRGVNIQGVDQYLDGRKRVIEHVEESHINDEEPVVYFQHSSLKLVDIGEISAAFRIFQLCLKLTLPEHRFYLAVLTAKYIKFHVPTLLGSKPL